jgi:xylulokinase
VARAAYEGVVLGLVNGQRHLERMGVATTGSVLAVGGGAKSPAYQQLLADATARPISVPRVAEATARGAAVQAAAVATREPVTRLRDSWRPSSRVVATPRPFGAERWRAYEAVTAVRSLDRS